jgi:hypothetical protein
LKQHDKQSSMSSGSRDMARDPQGRYADDGTRPRKKVRTFSVGERSFDAPEYGEVTLTFHDGQLRYVEKRTKEKVE